MRLIAGIILTSNARSWPPRSYSCFSSPYTHLARRIHVPYYLEFAYENPRTWLVNSRQVWPTFPLLSHFLSFLLSDCSTMNRACCTVARCFDTAFFYSYHLPITVFACLGQPLNASPPPTVQHYRQLSLVLLAAVLRALARLGSLYSFGAFFIRFHQLCYLR